MKKYLPVLSVLLLATPQQANAGLQIAFGADNIAGLGKAAALQPQQHYVVKGALAQLNIDGAMVSLAKGTRFALAPDGRISIQHGHFNIAHGGNAPVEMLSSGGPLIIQPKAGGSFAVTPASLQGSVLQGIVTVGQNHARFAAGESFDTQKHKAGNAFSGPVQPVPNEKALAPAPAGDKQNIRPMTQDGLHPGVVSALQKIVPAAPNAPPPASPPDTTQNNRPEPLPTTSQTLNGTTKDNWSVARPDGLHPGVQVTMENGLVNAWADPAGQPSAGRNRRGIIANERSPLGDVLAWARWLPQTGPGEVFNAATQSWTPDGTAQNRAASFIAGAPVTQLPVSGMAEMRLVGGTRPVTLGTQETGQLTGGSLRIDFANQRVAMAMGLSANSAQWLLQTPGGLDQVSSKGMQLVALQNGPAIYFAGATGIGQNDQQIEVHKDGVSCPACQGSVNGFLAGSHAQAAGLGYTITPAGAGDAAQISGVAGFHLHQ